MSRQQSPIKEIWGKVIYLLAITLTGLFYGVIIMVPLMMLLGLDSVDEFVNPPITLFFLWIICTVGWHLYLKGQEKKKMQEQLDKLKRKETVYNPRQGLMAGKESKEETSPSQSKDTKNEIEYWQIVGCQKPPVKEELEQNLKVTDNKRPTH